jgi:hypothetical protein
MPAPAVLECQMFEIEVPKPCTTDYPPHLVQMIGIIDGRTLYHALEGDLSVFRKGIILQFKTHSASIFQLFRHSFVSIGEVCFRITF